MFSTFLECSQMPGVFYDSINGMALGLLSLLYDIDFRRREWKVKSKYL